MFTLLIIAIVIISVLVTYARYKQEQIVNLTHKELLEKHQHAYSVYKGWLIFSILLFVFGYILSQCFPMYETEEYEYWLFGTQKGTREALTTSAWWSYILRGLGVLAGIPSLIGFLDRWNAVKKYQNMSYNEYVNLQHTTRQDIKQQDKNMKEAKRRNTIIKIIGKIISG